MKPLLCSALRFYNLLVNFFVLILAIAKTLFEPKRFYRYLCGGLFPVGFAICFSWSVCLAPLLPCQRVWVMWHTEVPASSGTSDSLAVGILRGAWGPCAFISFLFNCRPCVGDKFWLTHSFSRWLAEWLSPLDCQVGHIVAIENETMLPKEGSVPLE